jgi:hypothetical protein
MTGYRLRSYIAQQVLRSGVVVAIARQPQQRCLGWAGAAPRNSLLLNYAIQCILKQLRMLSLFLRFSMCDNCIAIAAAVSTLFWARSSRQNPAPLPDIMRTCCCDVFAGP